MRRARRRSPCPRPDRPIEEPTRRAGSSAPRALGATPGAPATRRRARLPSVGAANVYASGSTARRRCARSRGSSRARPSPRRSSRGRPCAARRDGSGRRPRGRHPRSASAGRDLPELHRRRRSRAPAPPATVPNGGGSPDSVAGQFVSSRQVDPDVRGAPPRSWDHELREPRPPRGTAMRPPRPGRRHSPIGPRSGVRRTTSTCPVGRAERRAGGRDRRPRHPRSPSLEEDARLAAGTQPAGRRPRPSGAARDSKGRPRGRSCPGRHEELRHAATQRRPPRVGEAGRAEHRQQLSRAGRYAVDRGRYE